MDPGVHRGVHFACWALGEWEQAALYDVEETQMIRAERWMLGEDSDLGPARRARPLAEEPRARHDRDGGRGDGRTGGRLCGADARDRGGEFHDPGKGLLLGVRALAYLGEIDTQWSSWSRW